MPTPADEERRKSQLPTGGNLFSGHVNSGVLGYDWVPKENPALLKALNIFAQGLSSFFDFSKKEYSSITSDLMKRVEYLNEMAWRDHATGRLNRHAFDREINKILDERLTKALATAKENSATKLEDNPDDTKVIIAKLDLNYLKTLNKFSYTHGGDAALKYMADFIYKTLRTKHRAGEEQQDNLDTMVRYGGDEFVLIMRGCSLDDANARLQKLSKEIAKQSVGGENPCIGRSEDGIEIPIPVSFAFGCTEFSLAGHKVNDDINELKARIILDNVDRAGIEETKNKIVSKRYAGDSTKCVGGFALNKDGTERTVDELTAELAGRVAAEKEKLETTGEKGGWKDYKIGQDSHAEKVGTRSNAIDNFRKARDLIKRQADTDRQL